MVITVGGLLITAGIIGGVVTLGATALAVFAASMSDNPNDQFSWKWISIGAGSSAALVLVGVFGGL